MHGYIPAFRWHRRRFGGVRVGTRSGRGPGAVRRAGGGFWGRGEEEI
jgi:hypothetical protein